MAPTLKKSDKFLTEVEACQEKLYRFILKHTKNIEATKDIMQETIMKAYQYHENRNPEFPIQILLFKIAKCTIIDELRTAEYRVRKTLISIDTDEGVFDIPDHNDPLISAENGVLHDDLKSAVDNLPENLKDVLWLCYFENFSYQEAADTVHSSVCSVRNRLSRARNSLKTHPLVIKYQ